MNTASLPPICPLLYNKAPRWTDETKTECGCDFCQHWHPLIKHLQAQLDDEGKKLLNELVEQWMNESQDLEVDEAKLAGDWPGWEAMKNFKPTPNP
jgi:hypothetical protein